MLVPVFRFSKNFPIRYLYTSSLVSLGLFWGYSAADQWLTVRLFHEPPIKTTTIEKELSIDVSPLVRRLGHSMIMKARGIPAVSGMHLNRAISTILLPSLRRRCIKRACTRNNPFLFAAVLACGTVGGETLPGCSAYKDGAADDALKWAVSVALVQRFMPGVTIITLFFLDLAKLSSICCSFLCQLGPIMSGFSFDSTWLLLWLY